MLTTAPAFPAAECHHVSQCVCAGGGNGFLRRAQCIPSGHVMAKNQHGERQPYLPTRKWVDGSIADDLPAKRLQRLYSTNQVDLGSRRGLPGFVPGRMTGLPPEFYTLKTPQWLRLNALNLALTTGQAMCIITRFSRN